ncbi:hypothetical protein Tco_1254565 [Tanacetum coccineum]
MHAEVWSPVPGQPWDPLNRVSLAWIQVGPVVSTLGPVHWAGLTAGPDKHLGRDPLKLVMNDVFGLDMVGYAIWHQWAPEVYKKLAVVGGGDSNVFTDMLIGLIVLSILSLHIGRNIESDGGQFESNPSGNGWSAGVLVWMNVWIMI